MQYKYRHSILGGTFDHLHIGHKKLLDEAFNLSEKVTIGLSMPNLYQKKFLSHIIDPYQTREAELKKYLQEKNYLYHARIVPLNDIFGPSLEIKNIDAIFVTQTTLPNAQEINKERSKKSLTLLQIVTVPFVNDEAGQVITSERIRLGEIDREGRVYLNIFAKKNKINLPEFLRKELRQPAGRIITDVKKIKDIMPDKSLLITVGDIVTKSLRGINHIPDIEIIDFKTRRSLIDNELINAYKKKNPKIYTNPPGTINRKVVEVYIKAINTCLNQHQKQSIIIEGEEDLLTLPAILFAPLHSFVCYGQFDLNAAILVEVTEEKKKFAYSILRKFI